MTQEVINETGIQSNVLCLQIQYILPHYAIFFRLVEVSVNHVSISLLHYKVLGLRYHTFFTLCSLSLSPSLSLPTKIFTIYNTWLALSNMLLYCFQVVSVPMYLLSP